MQRSEDINDDREVGVPGNVKSASMRADVKDGGDRGPNFFRDEATRIKATEPPAFDLTRGLSGPPYDKRNLT